MDKASIPAERTEIISSNHNESARHAVLIKGMEDFNTATSTLTALTNKALAMHEDMCKIPEALTPIVPNVENEGFIESYAPATVIREVVSRLNSTTMALCAVVEEFIQTISGNPDVIEVKAAGATLAVECQKALLEVETQNVVIAAMERDYLDGVTTHYKTIHARETIHKVIDSLGISK